MSATPHQRVRPWCGGSPKHIQMPKMMFTSGMKLMSTIQPERPIAHSHTIDEPKKGMKATQEFGIFALASDQVDRQGEDHEEKDQDEEDRRAAHVSASR